MNRVYNNYNHNKNHDQKWVAKSNNDNEINSDNYGANSKRIMIHWVDVVVVVVCNGQAKERVCVTRMYVQECVYLDE